MLTIRARFGRRKGNHMTEYAKAWGYRTKCSRRRQRNKYQKRIRRQGRRKDRIAIHTGNYDSPIVKPDAYDVI